jgi:hypothetical protein
MAKEKYHLLRTPSARRIDGVCVPVFEPEAIDEVAHDYFFKIHVNPDRSINVNGGRPYLNFTTSVERAGGSLWDSKSELILNSCSIPKHPSANPHSPPPAPSHRT